MKPVRVTFDEQLLDRFDADEDVRRFGRAAVLRHAVEMYLAHRRRSSIAAAYRTAYADISVPEVSGWDDEGEWPER